MGSIQIERRPATLIIDFDFQGHRCREQTALPDTAANRKRLEKVLVKIEEEISLGTFSYRRFFPGSKNAVRFDQVVPDVAVTPVAQAVAGIAGAPATPLFRDFAEVWYGEKSIEWRKSHQKTIRDDIDKRLVPRFGDMAVGRITKADILAFRADLAKAPARGKTQLLSNPRINKILNPLRQILCEAADRFDFRTPFQNIKQLRVKRTDVDPFSLDEVRKIIDAVRSDFKDYFTLRFFTGMRTGEIHGLKWQYVDFERRLIMVREPVRHGAAALGARTGTGAARQGAVGKPAPRFPRPVQRDVLERRALPPLSGGAEFTGEPPQRTQRQFPPQPRGGRAGAGAGTRP